MSVLQSDATVQIVINQPNPAPITRAAIAVKKATGQAQQWLSQEGVYSNIHELVSYVDAISSTHIQHSERAQQHGMHLQLSQLQAKVQQQTEQLQRQQAELDVLRSLQPGAAGGSQLYQELDKRQQEMVAWRNKYQLELQCRDTAESALKETLVVVDQLTDDCAAVSSMLKDVLAVEAASSADTAGASAKAAGFWLRIEIGIAAVLIICTAAATYMITRSVMPRS